MEEKSNQTLGVGDEILVYLGHETSLPIAQLLEIAKDMRQELGKIRAIKDHLLKESVKEDNLTKELTRN